MTGPLPLTVLEPGGDKSQALGNFDRSGQPGDRNALRRVLWDGLQTAHGLLRSRKAETRLKAIHALSQIAATYDRALGDDDLEAQLALLEDRLEEAGLLKSA